mgnify:CR=1 FL=1
MPSITPTPSATNPSQFHVPRLALKTDWTAAIPEIAVSTRNPVAAMPTRFCNSGNPLCAGVMIFMLAAGVPLEAALLKWRSGHLARLKGRELKTASA